MSATSSNAPDDLFVALPSRQKSPPQRSKQPHSTQNDPVSPFAQLLTKNTQESQSEADSKNSPADNNESKRADFLGLKAHGGVSVVDSPARSNAYKSYQPYQATRELNEELALDFLIEGTDKPIVSGEIPIALPAQDQLRTNSANAPTQLDNDADSELSASKLSGTEISLIGSGPIVTHPPVTQQQTTNSDSVEDGSKLNPELDENESTNIHHNDEISFSNIGFNQQSTVIDSHSVGRVEKKNRDVQSEFGSTIQTNSQSYNSNFIHESDAASGERTPYPFSPQDIRVLGNQKPAGLIDNAFTTPSQLVDRQYSGIDDILVSQNENANGLPPTELEKSSLPSPAHQQEVSSVEHDLAQSQTQSSHLRFSDNTGNDAPLALQESISSSAGPQKTKSESVLHQAGTSIVQAIEGGKAIRMRMNPPELGLLNIEIAAIDGSLTARLDVESAQTHRVLVDNLSHLHEMLHRNNTQIERIELNVVETLADASHQSRNSNSFSSSGNHRNDQGAQPNDDAKINPSNTREKSSSQIESKPQAMQLLSGIDIHA